MALFSLYFATLATFIRFAARILIRLVHLVFFSVYFSGVPPSNWSSREQSASHKRPAAVKGHYARQQDEDYEDYEQSAFQNDPSVADRIFLDDVPACIEIPVQESVEDATVLIKVEIQEEPSTSHDATFLSSSLTEIGFSIYSDVSSPSLNKAAFITPRRPSLVSVKELEFNLLKAASERVSEILRENRRRLDAGEDSNATRREARRKRAQELASRNKSGRSTLL